MSRYEQSRRQQALSEAEGYLDLVSGLGESEAEAAVRDRLAQRALDVLHELSRETSWRRGQVLYLRGQALRIMQRYREAIDPLVESSQVDSDNLHVWLALGWCYKRIGRLDLAIQALEEALSVEPDEAIVHYNLACYWTLAGNKESALRYLAQALSIDPDCRQLIDDEPDFDPIRYDPDFQALLGQTGAMG